MRKILWLDEIPEGLFEAPSIQTPDVIQTGAISSLVVEAKRAYKERQGNGHVAGKHRDLTDHERTIIRTQLFIPKNGMLELDDVTSFWRGLRNDLTVFQVTGNVSVLHTEVAEGKILLQDLAAYENWMRTKYGRMWARYNLPKFVQARNQNRTQVLQEVA